MNFFQKLRLYLLERDKGKNENAGLDQTTYSLSMKTRFGLIQSPERKIVAMYVLAYVMPLLVALIDRIPTSETNIASLISPFGYYAILLPLSMVFFGPFFLPFPLASVLGILASIMFLVSFLSYPVISCLLLRRNGAGWILSFIYSLATIGLDVFIISNIPELAVIWLFGIAMNLFVLYLLYSCRNEFLY
jgi:hypothetical protein